PVAPGATALDGTAFAFLAQTPLLRAARWLRRDPGLRHRIAGGHECGQAIAGVFTVALLGAEALGADHQHAGIGDPAIAARQQARAHVFGQRRRAGDVEAQLDRGGDLVDVLSTRPARTHEAFD